MNRASHTDRTLIFVGCAIASFGLPLQLFASLVTTNVSIIDFAFSPSAIVINANESVVWTWAGASVHSSSSDTGLWDSGILSPGSQFTNNFPTAGTFPYHCNVHSFMTGSVTVQAQVQAAPQLSAAKRISNTSFQFSYSAASGSSYIVLRSSDLIHWNPLATNLASSTSVTFTDPTATAAAQFYKVQLK